MDFAFDYVIRSAQKKYERDLKACTFFGKVQPRKLAAKMFAINDRIGDGDGGLLGHNLDKLKTLADMSVENAALFTECMVLALSLQKMAIFARSQNYPIARYGIEDLLNGQNRLTDDTDPKWYLGFLGADDVRRHRMTHTALSERFLRHSRDMLYPVQGALYGILHPAFAYAFEHYFDKDDYHKDKRALLESFFEGEARTMWESRKGDIPVLIYRGHIVSPAQQ